MRTLKRLVSMAATIALAAGALVASGGTAQAATKTQTATVAVSTTKLENHETLKVSVTTSPVAKKATIKIQRKYAGSSKWTTVKTAKTNSAGKYTWSTKMANEKDRYYRVYVPKRSGYTKAYSKSSAKVVVVGATFKVSAAASPTSIVGSGTVTISGKATPYKSKSKTVTIQRSLNGGAWKNVATATVSSAGNYKASVKLSTAGNYQFRVYKPKYSDWAARYSSVLKVTVTSKVTGAPEGASFTLSKTSGKASSGDQVTVTGPMTGAKAARVQFKDGTTIKDTSNATLSGVTTTQATVTMPAGPAGFTGTLQVQFADNKWLDVGTYAYTLVERTPTVIEQALLAKFNENRATDQICYKKTSIETKLVEYPAVSTPLEWDGKLGDYALAFAKEIASQRGSYEALYDHYSIDDLTWRSFWGPSADGIPGDVRAARAGLPSQPGETWDSVNTAEQNTDPTLIYSKTGGDNVKMLGKSACSLVMDSGYTKIGIGFVPRTDTVDGVIVVTLLP